MVKKWILQVGESNGRATTGKSLSISHGLRNDRSFLKPNRKFRAFHAGGDHYLCSDSDTSDQRIATAYEFVQTLLMKKKLGVFLGLEILVIGLVILIFRTIERRLIAGLVAGSIFIILGLIVLSPGFKSAAFRRTPTFVMAWVHLLFSALPLFISRLCNWNADFKDVRVMGLNGPHFHTVSTGIYFLLMAATAFDAIRTK